MADVTVESVGTESDPLALELYEQSKSIAVIYSDEDLQFAADIYKAADTRVKGFEALRVEEKKKILEAGRDCDERWNKRKEPYAAILQKIKPAMETYLDAKRKAEEERARLANEAAEKERVRLQNLAAENERKAEEARAAGDDKKAERLEAKADGQAMMAATVPVVATPDAQRIVGLAAARPWKATCTSLEKLIAAAFTDADPVVRNIARSMLKIEFSQIDGNRQASKTKTTITIPGVVFSQGIQVRGR